MEEEQRAQKLFITIGNWRLMIAIAAALLAWAAFGAHAVSGWILVVPLAAFIALVVWHQRVIARRTQAQRAVRFYDDGLARLQNAWAGRGITGDQYREPSHIYAEDLDVFGKGSLFELIARTRTNAGEELLARWLLAPTGCEQALARQPAINELRFRLDLREDIALLGEDIRSDVKAQSLIGWGAAPDVRFAPALRPLCLFLAITGLIFLIAFFAGWLPIWPLVAVLACNFTLIFVLRHRVSNILAGVESSGRDLTIISLMLKRLESERFESPRLQELRSALDIRGLTASRRIAKLGRLIEVLDSSDHVLVRAIRPLVLWNEQLAMALEAWRRDSGRHIGLWIADHCRIRSAFFACFHCLRTPQLDIRPLERISTEPISRRGAAAPVACACRMRCERRIDR